VSAVKAKIPRRVPRTALEQCRREYEIVKRERDEARAALRVFFENLQAWLTEHNLAAQERTRKKTAPVKEI
jgi:hypothetical protein